MGASEYIAIAALVLGSLTALLSFGVRQTNQLYQERIKNLESRVIENGSSIVSMTRDFTTAMTSMTAKYLDAMTQVEATFTQRAATYSSQLESRFTALEGLTAETRVELNRWELHSTEEHSNIRQSLPTNYITRIDFAEGISSVKELFASEIRNVKQLIERKLDS